MSLMTLHKPEENVLRAMETLRSPSALGADRARHRHRSLFGDFHGRDHSGLNTFVQDRGWSTLSAAPVTSFSRFPARHGCPPAGRSAFARASISNQFSATRGATAAPNVVRP